MKLNRLLALSVAGGILSATSPLAQEGEASPTEIETTEENKPVIPETPADVAAAPEDAEKTPSGLASKVLQAGTGTEKPGPSDTVTVHYSGWETSGELFDSSVKRGEPTSFPLNGVIKGWTEGLQLMVVGEKRRFWIPEDLAYGPKVEGSGRPGGTLVFDVELLAIKSAPKPPEDTLKTPSGVAYKIVKEGSGEKPTGNDVITFHFTGRSMEGQVLQDSKADPEPPSLNLDKLPDPMRENFSDMKVGEVRNVWLPEPRVPGGFLVAEMELIAKKEAPPAPAVPEDVAAAPADAEKTESGLASKVLQAGTGTDKPAATSTVKVHYSGWETNGEMFDSSVTRGEPVSFPLNGVIKGWTEGVQLMVVGEKRRFWIPENLAYGPKVEGSGRPGGMLVFDVELLEIK
ncbi:MAG: FKBP-type peptidyl-prolyl cis-trans isomerase [Verrucomicrobiota bacterium]